MSVPDNTSITTSTMSTPSTLDSIRPSSTRPTTFTTTDPTPGMTTRTRGLGFDDEGEKKLRDATTLAIERHVPEWVRGPREPMSGFCFHQHIADEIVLTLKLLGYPNSRNWVMYCGEENLFRIAIKTVAADADLITTIEMKPNE